MTEPQTFAGKLGVTRMYVPDELVSAVTALIATHHMRGRKFRVLKDYCKGLAVEMIARKHGITSQGVCMIVKRSGVKQRRQRRAA